VAVVYFYSATSRRYRAAMWSIFTPALTPEQDCSVDLPHTVYWSDGGSATTEDYLTHLLDTFERDLNDRS
jgi:hypothetical protein